MQYCTRCGADIEEWDSAFYVRGLVCQPCYDSMHAHDNKELCNGCYSYAEKNKDQYILGKFYCDRCYQAQKEIMKGKICKDCGRLLPDNEKRMFQDDGSIVCTDCLADLSKKAGMRIRVQAPGAAPTGRRNAAQDSRGPGSIAQGERRLPMELWYNAGQRAQQSGGFFNLAKRLLARA
ncbi:MAG TPA: hypothetical protein PLO51_03375 [Candidatus Micrarchaeota archaeon]|nr:hypothetical protein [Candidatus Micrarchaeota archaeon]